MPKHRLLCKCFRNDFCNQIHFFCSKFPSSKNISIISRENDGDTVFLYSVIFQGTSDQAGNRRYLQSRCHIHRSMAERCLW